MTQSSSSVLAEHIREANVLHDAFRLAAAAYPDEDALVWSGGSLTYRALQDSVLTLAQTLTGTSRVAVFNDRSPNLATAVLAILEVGAAYVPLDSTYPDDRLTYMVENSNADALICPTDLVGLLKVPERCRTIVVDSAVAKTDTHIEPRTSPSSVSSADLAYVSYTSGSTGRPKGVAMPHRALMNLVRWQVNWSASTVGWRTLQLSPLSVDISFQEMFTTWASGGAVVLIDEAVRQDPQALLSYIIDQRMNRLFAPFVMLQEIIRTACETHTFPQDLREVITLGEQLQVGDDVRKFFSRTGATLENQYGTTETHVVTAHRLVGTPDQWPPLPSIGKAIDHTSVEVLNEDHTIADDGVEGEIGISGIALADGYLELPEMTRAKFVVSADKASRTYMTGDYGLRRPNGELEYRGRRDTQVKIQGFRVEIGEVETCIRDLPAVADAVVTAAPSEDTGHELTAHCIAASGYDVRPDEVLAKLSLLLTSYMLPKHIRVVPRFPYTPAGKVDRAQLAKDALAAG